MKNHLSAIKKGFTLIELMIVVTIISILALVVIPKFNNLMQSAKEGSTKGNLGVLRSAIKMYYAENEGLNPSTLTAGLIPKHLNELPPVRIGTYNHPIRSGEISATDDPNAVAGWVYPDLSTPDFGKVWVNCTHTDTKGEIVSTW